MTAEVGSKLVGFGPPVWVFSEGVPNRCPTCNGKGYTKNTATVFSKGRTLKQGSGCPTCKGTGQIPVDEALKRLMEKAA